MFHNLSGLLDDALKRNHIHQEVTVSQALEAANAELAQRLPTGRKTDAVAVSIRERQIIVMCANPAAAQLITQQGKDICAAITKKYPRADLAGVRTMIGRPRRAQDVLE